MAIFYTDFVCERAEEVAVTGSPYTRTDDGHEPWHVAWAGGHGAANKHKTATDMSDMSAR